MDFFGVSIKLLAFYFLEERYVIMAVVVCKCKEECEFSVKKWIMVCSCVYVVCGLEPTFCLIIIACFGIFPFMVCLIISKYTHTHPRFYLFFFSHFIFTEVHLFCPAAAAFFVNGYVIKKERERSVHNGYVMYQEQLLLWWWWWWRGAR